MGDEPLLGPAHRVRELFDGAEQVIGFDLVQGLADGFEGVRLGDVAWVRRVDCPNLSIADRRARALGDRVRARVRGRVRMRPVLVPCYFPFWFPLREVSGVSDFP